MFSSYEQYCEEVRSCHACTARKDCTNPVAGVGNFLSPKLILVGRNPGKNEDRKNKPFVGRSGEVLHEMIRRCGVNDEVSSTGDIFVTNLYLCYTMGNRLPLDEEAKTCIKKFLKPTLETIKKGLIVTFGATTNLFINSLKEIRREHGKPLFHKSLQRTVVPAFHPAQILYNRKLTDEFFSLAPIIKDLLSREENKNAVLHEVLSNKL